MFSLRTSISVLGRPGLVSRQVVQRHIRCGTNNKLLYTPPLNLWMGCIKSFVQRNECSVSRDRFDTISHVHNIVISGKCPINFTNQQSTINIVITRGTPQVQFANIRKMVLCQDLRTLFTAASRHTRGTSCPKQKVLTQIYIRDRKIWKFFWTFGNGRNKAKRLVISSSVHHLISLIFAIHVSFIIPLPMTWIFNIDKA